MTHHESEPDYLDLIAALHENREISEDRQAALLNRLKNDAELRQTVAAELQMAGLTRVVQAGESRWLELEELLCDETVSDSWENGVMNRLDEASRPSPLKWWLPLSIAAALAIAALIAIWNRPLPPDESVARIIRIDGGEVQTESGSRLQASDRLLPGDTLAMSSGMVEVAFIDTGVHMLATAPLSITTHSRNRIYVDDGEVKLHVPPQGVGFIVETEQQKITDLGTSFVLKAREQGSQILVLDGEIAVDDRQGGQEQLMHEGQLAEIEPSGAMRLRQHGPSGVPELSVPSMTMQAGSLAGRLFAFDNYPGEYHPLTDRIGARFLPLIRSGFTDDTVLSGLREFASLRFTGIAGTYDSFPQSLGIDSYDPRGGWVAWYSGAVSPPSPGKYRFWGYADNHLLVAIDGQPVFEGSRYSSSLREKLSIPRRNHPSLPCLNSTAGFASGEWFEVSRDAAQIDILFGEQSANMTAGLLLIERHGESYDEAYWGQPKWPLFLCEMPSSESLQELNNLREHMEEKLMGSFTIDKEALWEGGAKN